MVDIKHHSTYGIYLMTCNTKLGKTGDWSAAKLYVPYTTSPTLNAKHANHTSIKLLRVLALLHIGKKER